MFAAKYDRPDRHRCQRRPLLRGRVKKAIFPATLSRRLFLAIRMWRTRRRGDNQPRTDDEHGNSYGAIARSLRLLEPRQKCPESLQGLVSRIFSFFLFASLIVNCRPVSA
jgi:hypothetical protein